MRKRFIDRLEILHANFVLPVTLSLSLLLLGCTMPPGPSPGPGPTPDPMPNDFSAAIADVLHSDRQQRAEICNEIADRLNEPEFEPKDHWNGGDKRISEKTSEKLRTLIKSRLDKGPDDAAWRDIGKGYRQR